MSAEIEKLEFEQAMEKLEGIVSQLERGELPLSKALESFESGATLVKVCQKRLDDAQMRIEKIMVNGKESE